MEKYVCGLCLRSITSFKMFLMATMTVPIRAKRGRPVFPCPLPPSIFDVLQLATRREPQWEFSRVSCVGRTVVGETSGSVRLKARHYISQIYIIVYCVYYVAHIIHAFVHLRNIAPRLMYVCVVDFTKMFGLGASQETRCSLAVYLLSGLGASAMSRALNLLRDRTCFVFV